MGAQVNVAWQLCGWWSGIVRGVKQEKCDMFKLWGVLSELTPSLQRESGLLWLR